MAIAKLPDINAIVPQLPPLQVKVNVFVFCPVSVATTTSPTGIPPAGAVHFKTPSPGVPNTNVLLLNLLSVKYISVPAGIALAATNEKPSGVV